MKTTSILIVDDHTLIRETWSFILKRDLRFNVIGSCTSGEDAIEIVKTHFPDIVLMDIGLPGIDGIEATEMVLKYSPLSKVIGVSHYAKPLYAKKIFSRGALGYVTKSSGKDELLKAIIEVYQGNRYICDELKEIIAEQAMSDIDPEREVHSLSQREMEIIKYLSQGLSSKEIASILFISIKTVEVHRYNVLKKLKLKNTAALVNYIHDHHLGVN